MDIIINVIKKKMRERESFAFYESKKIASSHQRFVCQLKEIYAFISQFTINHFLNFEGKLIKELINSLTNRTAT